MIKIMFEMQDTMNSKVWPDGNWLGRYLPWGRTIFQEAAELVDHFEWKFWKDAHKHQYDAKQIHLEVIDIIHFVISYGLAKGSQWRQFEHDVFDDFEPARDIDQDAAIKSAQLLAASAVQGAAPSVVYFELRQLLIATAMTKEMVFKMYIGKNVLNGFRQDFGYKQGTYVKIWHGREDNEVLSEILDTMEVSEDMPNDIYAKLILAYQDVGPVTA